MIIGPRRLALIGAIAAVALTIIFYPLLVATPFNPNDVDIKLSRVALASGSEGEQKLDLRVSLNLTNTSEFTLTTSKIEYELFADGVPVGTDTISYEDVPINGRPALFTNQPITISDTFNSTAVSRLKGHRIQFYGALDHRPVGEVESEKALDLPKKGVEYYKQKAKNKAVDVLLNIIFPD